MSSLLLQSLYFFLPAYVANMMPVFVRKIPWGNKPIHAKLLGAHKTWRGLVSATLAGGIIFAVQKYLYFLGYDAWALIDYADYSILLGFLLGFGAIAGDMVESYYKRKAEIPAGEPWIPFDQVDFVFGATVFSFFVFVPPAEVFAILLLVSPLLHFAVNIIGYWLGIRKSKW